MRTLAEERCSDPTNPKKDQKDGIAGPALTMVVRIRAREVVWGSAKIVILANCEATPVRRFPPMCQCHVPGATRVLGSSDLGVAPEEHGTLRKIHLSVHAVYIEPL